MSPLIKAVIAHSSSTVVLWGIENHNRWRIISLKIIRPLQINIWTNNCLLICKQRKRLKDSSVESRTRLCRNLLLDHLVPTKSPPSIKLDMMWQISRRSLPGNFGMLGRIPLENWVLTAIRSKIQNCFRRAFHRREVMKLTHNMLLSTNFQTSIDLLQNSNHSIILKINSSRTGSIQNQWLKWQRKEDLWPIYQTLSHSRKAEFKSGPKLIGTITMP